MKISKREMILICILLLVSTIYLVNKFVITTYNGQLKSLQSQKDNLTGQLQKINEIKSTTYSEKDNLQKQIDEINESTKKLFPELKYDKITVILQQMFKDSNLLCESMTFSEITSVNLEEPIPQPTEKKENIIDKLVKEYLKLIGSNKDGNENKDAKATVKSKAEISKLSVTLNFRGKYSELTTFMKALEGFEKLIIINNITVTSAEKGQVGGVLNIDLYSIPKPFEDNYFKYTYSKPTGIGNPFTGEGTTASSTEATQSSHFILTAKPSSSDISIFSLMRVGNEKSTISSNGNGVENVEITFTEDQGKIYFKYKNGSKAYPSNYSGKGEAFTVDGDNIIITANSILRNSDQDLSGVSLTVNNNTKKVVKLMITNDDTKRPRILLASKKGEVIEDRK